MADFIQRRDQAIIFSDFRKQNLRAAGWDRLFMIPAPQGDTARRITLVWQARTSRPSPFAAAPASVTRYELGENG
jgi:hypothetical protein